METMARSAPSVDLDDPATRERLAWLAGLLEGEGCFSRVQARRSAVVVHVNMADRDVVERARDLILELLGGELTVSHVDKKTRNPTHSDLWRIRLYSTRAAELMRLVRPWMGERRGARIDELLESLS